MLLYDLAPDPVKPMVVAAAVAAAALIVTWRRRCPRIPRGRERGLWDEARMLLRIDTWLPGGIRELLAVAAAFLAYAAALYAAIYVLPGNLLVGDDSPYYYTQLSFLIARHRLYWRDAPATYMVLAALYYLLGGDGFLAVEALHVLVLAALPFSTYLAARVAGKETWVSMAAAAAAVFLPGYFYLVVNAGGNYKQGLGTVILIPAIAVSARLRGLRSMVLRTLIPMALQGLLLAVHPVAAYAYLPVLLIVLAENTVDAYRLRRLYAALLAASYISASLAAATVLPGLYASKAVHGASYASYLYRCLVGVAGHPVWLISLLASTAIMAVAAACLYRRGYRAAALALASATAVAAASFIVGQPYLYGLRSPYYRFVSITLSLTPFIVFSAARMPRGRMDALFILLPLTVASLATPIASPVMYTGVAVPRTPCIDELRAVAGLVSMDDLVFVADDIPVRYIFLGMVADKTYKVYYASPLLLRQDTYRLLVVNKEKYNYTMITEWYMETHNTTVLYNGSCYIVLYIRGLRR